ncbi:MAG: GNAT family N-acetyltransferase [Isosphaeraceae bacterium]|nr:GNAT family N-acetyltransferase [Isosphaeraceae bacterium]
MPSTYEIRVLNVGDPAAMRGILSVFGRAFEDDAEPSDSPDDTYLAERLADPDAIAIAAIEEGVVVGGLTAHFLRKFGRREAEIYIYDLAVDEQRRRLGIATALIEAVRSEARARGASVVFVQAHAEDEAAVALYSKLGLREEVIHFTIDCEA